MSKSSILLFPPYLCVHRGDYQPAAVGAEGQIGHAMSGAAKRANDLEKTHPCTKKKSGKGRGI
jgi:hypothetical protein